MELSLLLRSLKFYYAASVDKDLLFVLGVGDEGYENEKKPKHLYLGIIWYTSKEGHFGNWYVVYTF